MLTLFPVRTSKDTAKTVEERATVCGQDSVRKSQNKTEIATLLVQFAARIFKEIAKTVKGIEMVLAQFAGEIVKEIEMVLAQFAGERVKEREIVLAQFACEIIKEIEKVLAQFAGKIVKEIEMVLA